MQGITHFSWKSVLLVASLYERCPVKPGMTIEKPGMTIEKPGMTIEKTGMTRGYSEKMAGARGRQLYWEAMDSP